MPTPQTLPEALVHAHGHHPERPAIYYFDTAWSYDELVDRVARVAGALVERGMKPGDRVAVMLQNMPASVVIQMAVWALGGTVVPLNIMFQPREMAWQLADAEVKTLVMLASVAHRLHHLPALSGLHLVIVVEDRQDFLGDAPNWLPGSSGKSWAEDTVSYTALLDHEPLERASWHRGAAGDLALLPYTSGTTGVPKGAMITHGHMLHNVEVYRRMAGLDSRTINIAFAPLFHITGSVAGLATAVGLGIPLVLLYRFDPLVAARAIERHRATFTVGAITTFLGLLALKDLDHHDLSSLSHAYSGGASVPRATVDAFKERTGVYVHNVYGLTESTNGLIMVPEGQRAPIDEQSGALSIGKPGHGIEVSIRDLERPHILQTPGALGELALRGDSMMDGYWHRPDANQSSFTNGWFLTGDVARMDADGWIYLVDRKKDLIISSGNKVWPRDVEDALYLHPGVQEAVVVGLPDPYRGEEVTAYVVRRPDTPELTEDDLIRFTREHLAAYKVPRRIHWVEKIPQTATGKFLRRFFREQAAGGEIL